MNKILSIVIPVFNKFAFTRSALQDLIKLPSNHELIIIDNASSDETQQVLSSAKEITYIRNEKNVFHSAACNQGYRLASSDNVLFINNDIKIKSNHNNWTKTIIDACKDNVLVGPTMGLLNSNFNFVKEANQVLTGNSYISGWCIAGNKNTWNKLDLGGGQVWDEKFPMYFNDTNMGFVAKKLGITLDVISLPDVVHFGKISSAQLNVNKLYNEGRQVFIKKWSNK